MMQNLWSDIRFGVRLLVKRPGFTAVAVLTLALGIGASTAIFTVVDTMLLRPLPFSEPSRLVRLWESAPSRGYFRNVVNPFNFMDWRDNARSFEGMAAIVSGIMNNQSSN